MFHGYIESHRHCCASYLGILDCRRGVVPYDLHLKLPCHFALSRCALLTSYVTPTPGMSTSGKMGLGVLRPALSVNGIVLAINEMRC